VLGIAELALNVLNGNCKISKISVDRLRKHNTDLRRLVDSGIARRKKKKPIVQRVVFLHSLLTASLSVLPSLIQLQKFCGNYCLCRPNMLNGSDAVMMTSTRKLITRDETCAVC